MGTDRDEFLKEHTIFRGGFRALHPHGGAFGEDIRGTLGVDSMGDWSWKPYRDSQHGHLSFGNFKGVPPSFAEARPRRAEPGAVFYGIPDHMVNETAEQFQARVLR